ncbi:MAG: hypothetical protein AB8B64_17255 [Granulosicoccus sp.]
MSYLSIYDIKLTCKDGLGTLPIAILITMDGSTLDDLIYNFLIQSGYPRASIVFDVDLLGPTAQVGSGMKVPAFVIVDPDTADPLAVIEIVEALDGELLKQVAIETGAYASRLAGKCLQGFVIRIDTLGCSEEEKVQFYRIWPNSTLQRLSSKNFPDLEALRVSRKLTIFTTAKEVESAAGVTASRVGSGEPGIQNLYADADADAEGGRREISRAGLYLPASILLLLFFADGAYSHLNGESFLTLSQSVLAVGAALLLTMPSAIRSLRK